MTQKIGITERGDPAIDYSWRDNLYKTNGKAILITKNLTDDLANEIMNHIECGADFILHLTCTGLGGTLLEPNVPPYATQLLNARKLINRGFDPKKLVIRIDPILPSLESNIFKVLDEAKKLELIPDARVRMSILDDYPHVKERFINANISYFNFDSPTFFDCVDKVNGYIQYWRNQMPDLIFESCAEPLLHTRMVGCVSSYDYHLLGLEVENDVTLNPQHRKGCLCLSTKTELLTGGNYPCPHECMYCYWKDK